MAQMLSPSHQSLVECGCTIAIDKGHRMGERLYWCSGHHHLYKISIKHIAHYAAERVPEKDNGQTLS